MPGIPHHVTQRGNRRQQTFFADEDYQAYLDLMAEWCGRCGVEIWAYCLMPNHVHLIAAPAAKEGLARAIGEAHRRYTQRINSRKGWRGYLWQGRFASFPMDNQYLRAAARYIELNPVRAKFVRAPWRWPWSSAAAHMSGEDDVLVKTGPLLKRAGCTWRDFLAAGLSETDAELLRRHERTGRPLGGDGFVARLEKALRRILHRQQPGRKRKRKRTRK